MAREPLVHRAVAAAGRRTPHRVFETIARASARSGVVRRVVGRLQGDFKHADVTIVRGEAAGLRINSADTIAGYARGSAEPLVQEALVRELRPGAVMYDIGANIGFFSLIGARAVGPDGRVVAFEPLPDNLRWLRHNAALNGFGHVEVVEAAVGAAAGQASFAVGGTAGWGRLDAGGAVPVEVIRLDELVAGGGIPAPDLIKMDIEGGEVDALDGMAGTLTEHAPTLIVEVHETLAPVTERLRAAGYAVERLDPREPDHNAHVVARRDP